MKILFMGTPDFAVPSLKALINSGYGLTAVVTQPDRRSGRGHALFAPPVKAIALENNIPVLQYEKIKSPEGVKEIKNAEPDLIITAAFGQILSKEILDIPPLGCINVHASLLPRYRGAAPVQWAIINGEIKTGVTIMYMDVGLDTGDIIASAETFIGENTTGGELYKRLSNMGADLLVKTIELIIKGTAKRFKQDDLKSSYYPPLSKETGRIDWKKPAKDIYNLVRALDPVMGAYSNMGENIIKIWSCGYLPGEAAPGQIIKANTSEGLVIGTGNGLINVKFMQSPGSKKMTPQEFFRGRKLSAERFE